MASPRERVIAISKERERIISRQALVMSLATKVLSETATDKAVQLLVDATYKVVNCDRVSLFLVQEGSLVCHAAPAGGQVGWRLPVGKGIAGRVGNTGETLNIPDAYKCPELFDSSNDLKTGYRTCSILCMPLKDGEGSVVGVLQAINKQGMSVPEFHAEEVCYVPFDSVDEKMLELLLALTAQQLRVCELVASKEAANDRADTVMQLLEAISSQRDIDSSVTALATAVATVSSCQQVFVYLREGEDLVCRAAHPLQGVLGERTDLSRTIVGSCASTAREILVNSEDNPEELLYVNTLLRNRSESPLERRSSKRSSKIVSQVAKSAMCIPLLDSETGTNIGVVLAVNKTITLTDLLADEHGPMDRPRRRSADGVEITHQALEASALENMLRHNAGSPVTAPSNDIELGRFDQSDLERLDVLVRLSAQMVTTAALYSQSQRTTKKLNALLMLLSGCTEAFEQRDLQRVVLLISLYSREMFECDRCTFFMVDKFSGQLVGHFVKDAQEGKESTVDQLQEFRVPMEGIAGKVAGSGQMLNIKDAYKHPEFSKANDEKTGYRTKTILGAPLTTSKGKVIAAIQCINKIRNEYFGLEDEKMMSTVSALLSDVCQRLLHQTSYKTFVQSSNSIEDEVKDLFREYYTAGDAKVKPYAGESDPKRMSIIHSSLAPHVDIVASLKSWSFDHEQVGEELAVTMPYATSCFSYFGLIAKYNIPLESLENFIQSVKASYNSSTPFHNWSHAFTTLHFTFLLLTSPAFSGILDKKDVLGLLIGAMGHDLEHPGFTNAFQVASQSNLAIRYNDESVLENHHAAVTSKLLKSEPDLYSNMDPALFGRIRKVILTSILGTDMAKHHETITWLETSNTVTDAREKKEPLEPDEALKLCKAILHSADIAHPSSQWKVHKRISVLVATEFYNQYQKETELRLPTLPFMGKDPGKLSELAPIQVGFVQFVVAPLWSAVNFAAGQDHLGFAVKNIESNKRNWQKLADGQDVPDEQPFLQPGQVEAAEAAT